MHGLAETEETITPIGEVELHESAPVTHRLSDLRAPSRGRVAAIEIPAETSGRHGVSPEELERRLLEMGFVEGAEIEILHEGLIGRDPIVVRLDGMRVALRRREACTVLVALAN